MAFVALLLSLGLASCGEETITGSNHGSPDGVQETSPSVGPEEESPAGREGASSSNQEQESTPTDTPPIGDPPTATILAPADGSSFAVLEDVVYEGKCTDSQGNLVTGSEVYWESRPCMADPHDMLCAVSYYFPGQDTTTLRCKDGNGLTAEPVSVTIDVYVSYARNVEPYLSGFGCTECHGAGRQEGGIRLDTYSELTTGRNENGPLIVAGDAGQGILIPRLQAAHHDPDPKTIFDHVPWVWMEQEDIETWWTLDLLAHWIDEGAPEN
jgi:hypothetical protein